MNAQCNVDGNVVAGHAGDATSIRHRLLENGYPPIPVVGKVPKLPGWPTLEPDHSKIRQWEREHPGANNTGVVCRTELLAFDIDVQDERVSAKIVERCRAIAKGAPFLIRIGKAPKALVVFRASEPMKKMATQKYKDPDTGIVHCVEALANGQQFVAFGIHPDTGEPYQWIGDSPLDVLLEDLPVLDPSTCEQFLADADELLAQQGWQPKASAAAARSNAGGNGQGATDTVFTRTNTEALKQLDLWVPVVFPSAKRHRSGCWRVTSKALGRDLEEDLSLHPDGIWDFGEERPMSAIDVVMKWGGRPSAKAAADWLCEIMSFDPNGDIADEFDDIDERSDDSGWEGRLERYSDGRLKSSLHNVKLIIRHDRRIGSLPQLNQFSGEIVYRAAPAVDHRVHRLVDRDVWNVTDSLDGDQWGDDHDHAVRAVIEAPEAQGGYGLRVSDRDVRAAIELVARETAFNPVREYLEEAEWDGQRRAESLFIDFLGAPDNAYTRETARLMLVAAVARIYEPGHKFDYVVVLEGTQGQSKSKFIETLGRNWATTLQGDFRDEKQMVETMLGSWFAELPEVLSLKRSGVNATKAFLSKTQDKVRLAYQRRAAIYKRSCIFIATTNEPLYLNDDTGNRRFWPIPCAVEEIDIAELESVIDQIWAEALHLYREMRAKQPTGTLPLYLVDAEVRREAERLQESRRFETVEDSWLGSIKAYFDSGEGAELEQFCQLQIWVNVLHQNREDYRNAVPRKLGRLLRRLEGWEEIGTRRHELYGDQKTYRRIASPQKAPVRDEHHARIRRRRSRQHDDLI